MTVERTVPRLAVRVKSGLRSRVHQEPVDCIVPAAGSSVRMGRWKPVLPFGDSTIVQTVVAAALRVCSRVVLVTGFRGPELAALFSGDPRVMAVHNDDWEQGMFSSIRAGSEHVLTPRFFVTLGDMPWIAPAVYEALLGWEGGDVVFAVHGGTRGHPVLFGDSVRAAIAAADPAAGSMREIVKMFRVGELTWPDDSVLRDVDTEQDLH
jgi:molybdenum cofactor cytidylyltransferase